MLKMIDVYSGSPRSFATDPVSDITMVKATQGTGYVNPYCNQDWDAAKNAGKLLGLYHYAGGGDAVREADYFISNIKGYVGQAVLALDWESNQNAAWGVNNWARRFVDRVHELTGVWPLIYVSQSAIDQVANCANTCGLWVARYAYNQPLNWDYKGANFSVAPWKTFTIHQFTGTDMDRNMVNTDREGWLRLAKGDGGAAPSPVPQPQPQPKPKPQAAGFTDEMGDHWTYENGKFTSTTTLHLRWGARPWASTIATLPAGSTIKYDAWSRGSQFVYIRQPRGNGQYGYVAVRDAKTGEAYGTFA
jgi:hypothetical protein